MNLKATIATIAGIFALIGTVWGSVTVFDDRYEMKEVHAPVHVSIQAEFSSMSYTALKAEIRAIRDAIWKLNGSDADRKRQLELDLKDAVDRLCLTFPTDRECK